MFSKELNYEHIYICTWIHVNRTIFENKKQFSGVTSRGLKWEDKYIQAKKSIDFGSAKSSSNRPFPSYTNAHFQNEAKRKTFLV